MDHQRVQKDFVDFYGDELLGFLHSSVGGESSWLKLIFQKHRKGSHPIRHLLIMQFLGHTLDDIFYNEISEPCSETESNTHRSKRKIMKKTMTPEYREQAKRKGEKLGCK
ncbi:TnsD family Tn7-like transposition protein [Paenibacillus sp. MER 180]|uniref:TnsD family Tn7-like transposition protein n=1 Tax=Paenibacillus sp. MER 180 TaxID=2939570 RepID=UPI00203C3D75|nr:TnsD family Tn7-like transposition protein [Paenibacillus sp. MER 180]MCM3291865.1 TnsD family Tn7-like transposition protein [Paenibacillus sp. MER 180]